MFYRGPQKYILGILSICITDELGYDVTKGAAHFLSLQTNVVLTEEYNVVVNSKDLIGTTEYLTL